MLPSIYNKIKNRERITIDEAEVLYTQADLLMLGQLANEIAREKNGRDVGYLIDRNINYTNVCALSCQFCNFYRKKSDDDAHTLSFEELDQKIEETLALGGTGILLQGGHHPDYKIEWYEDMFQHIRNKFPSLHLHALSPSEIEHIARISRLSFRETLTRLKAAGLMSIPGAGGEILVDRVRQTISAGKASSDQWLKIMRIAHELEIPSSATMMFGHIETLAERLIHLEKVRRAQDETGGFYAFIPWNFQSDGTELAQKAPIPSVSSHEFLRVLAIARIYLDNFKNIQVSWLAQGLKMGAVGLHFGANDMGSCMIEENVISQAGAKHQAEATLLKKTIEAAGFIAKQRNTCYDFIESKPAYVA